MNITDVPQWIRKIDIHKGMGGWADRLEEALPNISPYLEDNFCDNHFISCDDDVKRDKKLYEGLWHLHVLWSLKTSGFTLEKPDTNDDGLVLHQNMKIGIEATFSSWGNPHDKLSSAYRNMNKEFTEIDKKDIIDQAIHVLDNKNKKIIKRRPKRCRVVMLNELSLANGFWTCNKETTTERRQSVLNIAKQKAYKGMIGFTYDYVSYSDYFSKPNLTLCLLKENNSTSEKELLQAFNG